MTYYENAQRALGDTPPGFYFKSPTNLAFHDLTSGNSLSPATKIVMGLGNKFIPMPSPTPRKLAMESFERFQRDLHLKVFFADSDDQFFLPKSKLYFRSNWIPPLPPPKVDSRLVSFESKLRQLFYRKKNARSNFTTFQTHIFRKILDNDQIVFALADKGLGPVAIELERYIKDGLKHLQDASTYEIIPESQALAENDKLRKEIYTWTVQF